MRENKIYSSKGKIIQYRNNLFHDQQFLQRETTSCKRKTFRINDLLSVATIWNGRTSRFSAKKQSKKKQLLPWETISEETASCMRNNLIRNNFFHEKQSQKKQSLPWETISRETDSSMKSSVKGKTNSTMRNNPKRNNF